MRHRTHHATTSQAVRWVEENVSGLMPRRWIENNKCSAGGGCRDQYSCTIQQQTVKTTRWQLSEANELWRHGETVGWRHTQGDAHKPRVKKNTSHQGGLQVTRVGWKSSGWEAAYNHIPIKFGNHFSEFMTLDSNLSCKFSTWDWKLNIECGAQNTSADNVKPPLV